MAAHATAYVGSMSRLRRRAPREDRKPTERTRSSMPFSMMRFGGPDSSATSRGLSVAAWTGDNIPEQRSSTAPTNWSLCYHRLNEPGLGLRSPLSGRGKRIVAVMHNVTLQDLDATTGRGPLGKSNTVNLNEFDIYLRQVGRRIRAKRGTRAKRDD